MWGAGWGPRRPRRPSLARKVSEHKGLRQALPPAQAGASGPQGHFREMGRPLRKASFRKPPPRLWSGFAQKESNGTPLPQWLCAILFSLIMCATGQGCHYLHFMGEDTEGERIITCLKQEGQGAAGLGFEPRSFQAEGRPCESMCS